jgi:2-polyprenyl-3-methyl-5-hydroxy-6-metoxy-1,4-benzoquinol methylase
MRPALGPRTHRYQTNGHPMEWEYRLVRCSSCGMARIDPTPHWHLVSTFYDEDYGPYDASIAPPEREARSLKYAVASLRGAQWARGLDRARPQTYPRVRSLLGALAEVATGKTVTYSLGVPLQLDHDAAIFELGYGSGNWLLTMAYLGYRNLHGYDIAPRAQSTPRLKEAGVTTWHGIFLDASVPEGHFDCIRLEHVFEHLLDPVAVISKCHTMLRPGGCLVLNLPSAGSYSEAISLEAHPTLELPRHLYRHTPESAQLILRRAGFKISSIRVYTVPSHLAVVVNSTRDAADRRPLPTWLFKATGPLYAGLSHLARRGEHMTLYAPRQL